MDPKETAPQSANIPLQTKTKLPIFLILLFILIGVGGFVLGKYWNDYQNLKTKPQSKIQETTQVTPSPKVELTNNKTNNWKTYTNTKLKFSVNYPSSETITVQEDYGTWVKFEPLNFTIYAEPPGIGDPRIRTQVKVVDALLGIFPIKIYVFKFNSNPQSPENTHEIVVAKNNSTRGWIFKAETPENEIDTRLITIKQILSTFKFLDQTQIDTSSWKTYKSQNNKYKFEFNYPTEWKLTNSYLPLEKGDQENATLTFIDSSQNKVILPGDNQEYPKYIITITASSYPVYPTTKEDLIKQNHLESEIKTSRIDGIIGVRFFEGAAPSSGAVTVVSVKNNQKYFHFTYGAMAHPETHEKYLDIFDQIISTFKFLN